MSDHCGIVWSDLGRMTLSKVICKIFLSQVPMNSEMFFCNLNVLYLHGSLALYLDCSICNYSDRGSITVNWSGWLGVSHFSRMRLTIFLLWH